jgi:hypothetical protein
LFQSLARSKAQLDPEVVGLWRRSTYLRSGPSIGNSASLSSTTYYYFQFQPDGTVLHTVRDRVSGNTADLGVILSSDSGTQTQKGRWSNSAAGVLRLDWDGGKTETYAYRISVSSMGGTTLRLTQGNTKPLSFQRQATPMQR